MSCSKYWSLFALCSVFWKLKQLTLQSLKQTRCMLLCGILRGISIFFTATIRQTRCRSSGYNSRRHPSQQAQHQGVSYWQHCFVHVPLPSGLNFLTYRRRLWSQPVAQLWWTNSTTSKSAMNPTQLITD